MSRVVAALVCFVFGHIYTNYGTWETPLLKCDRCGVRRGTWAH